ncbi:GNAT family N-acetyltransferase [uncultured Algibacter sp.]|jgi:ribosomal protein S18 acetylase RimI-like enzyme|uniref:GNAT family N-acetyltransferase n=1 Tax=uncultured Algibacter sp. TaxID=298659 RepID=UPI0026302ABC|nr:GNAT family N-acetyltransferase [uncultured Algibacter sp.]
MIEIRRAISSDAIHIALLGRVTYTESHGDYIENKNDLLEFYNEHYAVSRIKEELNDDDILYWIVFSNELPVGFAKLALNIKHPTKPEINSCKLQRLYVLNDFIGLKIGSQLQEIILQKAIDLKFKKIWLTAYYKNKKGINFYKKYGFKKIGNIDFFVGNSNYPNLIFGKDL